MNLAIPHHRSDRNRHRQRPRDGVLSQHEGSVHLRMDAASRPCCTLGRAHPLRGPATRVAITRAPPTASPAVNARRGSGVRDLPPALPPRAADGPQGRRSGSAATAPSPLATSLRLNAAPFAPTDLRFPINLATALRLSDARPLIVAAAQASVWVAEAELTQAKVLWLPDAQHRLRLHPPRRRRPGLQQGHPDRAEHELLLRRCRPDGDTTWGSSPRPMPSTSPWWPGRS